MKEKNTTSVLETASKTGGGHRTEKQMTVGKSSFRFLVRRAAAAARVPVSDFLINFAGINTNVFIFCVSARFLPGARGGEKERERERERKKEQTTTTSFRSRSLLSSRGARTIRTRFLGRTELALFFSFTILVMSSPRGIHETRFPAGFISDVSKP